MALLVELDGQRIGVVLPLAAVAPAADKAADDEQRKQDGDDNDDDLDGSGKA